MGVILLNSCANHHSPQSIPPEGRPPGGAPGGTRGRGQKKRARYRAWGRRGETQRIVCYPEAVMGNKVRHLRRPLKGSLSVENTSWCVLLTFHQLQECCSVSAHSVKHWGLSPVMVLTRKRGSSINFVWVSFIWYVLLKREQLDVPGRPHSWMYPSTWLYVSKASLSYLVSSSTTWVTK